MIDDADGDRTPRNSPDQEPVLFRTAGHPSVLDPNAPAVSVERVSDFDRRGESIARGRLPVRSEIALVTQPEVGQVWDGRCARIWFDDPIPTGLRDRGDVQLPGLDWDHGIEVAVADLFDVDTFFRKLFEQTLVLVDEPEDLRLLDPSFRRTRWKCYVLSRFRRVASVASRVGRLVDREQFDLTPYPVYRQTLRLIIRSAPSRSERTFVHVAFDDSDVAGWNSNPIEITSDEMLDYWSFVLALLARNGIRFMSEEVESARDDHVERTWHRILKGMLADAILVSKYR